MKTESFKFIPALLVGIAVGIVVGSFASRAFNSPQVIVNMPEGASPLETLKPVPQSTVIPGDRAVLWWTVYDRTIKSWGPGDAKSAADRAVLTVYGPTPNVTTIVLPNEEENRRPR